jgi:beta-phosphoglucomutase
MIKAVIFDFDGTFADTMHFYFKSYKRALEGILDIRPYDLFIREGGGAFEIIADMLKGKKYSEADIRDIIKEKQKIYFSFEGKIKVNGEAKRIAKKWKAQGMKIGLATGTTRKALEFLLSGDEISLFDSIITGDESDKQKPHPEPFTKCMESMNIEPQEAVAIENAPLGIESAKKAGMLCIAITSTLPEKYLREADYVIDRFDEALDIIDENRKNPKN